MGDIFPLPRPCTIRFPRPNPHKSYLICIYRGKGIQACDFGSVSRVENPQVLSHLLFLVGDIFPLPHQCAIRFPKSNAHTSYLICFYTGEGHPGMRLWLSVQGRKPTSPLSSAVSGRYMVAIFPLPPPCAIRFPKSNPHTSYLICFYTGKGIQACDFGSVSRVENPQVLSHLLFLVGDIFSVAAPMYH